MSEASPAAAAQTCPVCGAKARFFLTADERDYWSCPDCAVRFLDPRHRPTREEELAQYLLHQNDPADPGYRRFLSRLADPLLARLHRPSTGLDYGCGPGPALAAILRERGHEVALFDPFFAPDRSALQRTYHFITCTETAEHFHHPAAEFARLMRMVRSGGLLAIMTCFQTDDARFASWHYRKDPSHVVFYREETFRLLANRCGWTCEVSVKDVALLRRPAAGEKP